MIHRGAESSSAKESKTVSTGHVMNQTAKCMLREIFCLYNQELNFILLKGDIQHNKMKKIQILDASKTKLNSDFGRKSC